jgi:hypothetical protein
VRQKNAVQEIDDTELISSAIDKCNLRPEYKRLLKILYVERGCLEDVCDAVGRDYSTVSKWHKPALIRLVRLLQKQGKIKAKINAKITKEKISLRWYNSIRYREIFLYGGYMAYNFGYNQNPYYTGYNPQIQQPQPQQTAPQPQVQSGFICRPVTSREEALATPCDFMAAGVIMPDMAHGMVYIKRFNSQTGASDFADFAYTPPTAPAKDTADYTPRADFDKLCAAFAALQTEVEKMKNPTKGKKEVTENA